MMFDCRSGNSDCCTPRPTGRILGGSASAVRAPGSNLAAVAKAPSVRTRLTSPFKVSPGRRPHLARRSVVCFFCDPQKLHVILNLLCHPDVLTLALKPRPQRSLQI